MLMPPPPLPPPLPVSTPVHQMGTLMDDAVSFLVGPELVRAGAAEEAASATAVANANAARAAGGVAAAGAGAGGGGVGVEGRGTEGDAGAMRAEEVGCS